MTASSSRHLLIGQEALTQVARAADRIMLVTLVASGLAALLVGYHYGHMAQGVGFTIVLCLPAVLVYAVARGTALSCTVFTLCNAALVALHIQLAHGVEELHFGVFVLLGLLLVYRDWRPLVLAAAFFAVHHFAFDRLQALQYGVFCTTQPNVLKVLVHAAYVVVQTGIELALATALRRAAIEAAELSAIVWQVDRQDALHLDMSDVHVRTEVAAMLKDTIEKMARAVADVSQAAGSIEQASGEIAAGSLNLSQRTEEQASSLQQTAASMENLTGSVRNTADAAQRAAQLASSASEAATRGGAAVGDVVATMQDMSESSRRIADITAVIDGIAFQTNILALNAAVEAARAGEQGRGFSVVAGEVRGLASRAAEAAKEIKLLIGDSVGRVQQGMELVTVAGAGMDGIVGHAREVNELIADMADAAGRQSEGIGEVGHAIARLDTGDPAQCRPGGGKRRRGSQPARPGDTPQRSGRALRARAGHGLPGLKPAPRLQPSSSGYCRKMPCWLKGRRRGLAR